MLEVFACELPQNGVNFNFRPAITSEMCCWKTGFRFAAAQVGPAKQAGVAGRAFL